MQFQASTFIQLFNSLKICIYKLNSFNLKLLNVPKITYLTPSWATVVIHLHQLPPEMKSKFPKQLL